MCQINRQSFLKLIIISFLWLSVSEIFAQAPQAFKYQTIVRNTSGVALSEQWVSLQFIIYENAVDGIKVYQESQSKTSDSNGLVEAKIGRGTVEFGDFSAINWGQNSYFLEVKIDGISMGISQLLSVPYALSAGSANALEITAPNGTVYRFSISTGGVWSSTPVQN